MRRTFVSRVTAWAFGLVMTGTGALVSAAVLTTITVDGDMSDWSAVLADPYQTAYDGPALGLVDLVIEAVVDRSEPTAPRFLAWRVR